MVIVAGGRGSRMKSQLPKQFIEVNGIPLIVHTLRRIRRFHGDIEMTIAMHPDWIAYWNELAMQYDFQAYAVVPGGAERFHSVQAGLELLSAEVVGVHDAVRPLVSIETLQRCFDTAAIQGNAVPVVPVTESLRRIEGGFNRAEARDAYRIVQTPQCFHRRDLLDAYQQGYKPFFTDDASVFEAAGHAIRLVDGNPENIKVTSPQDLMLAEHLLKENPA